MSTKDELLELVDAFYPEDRLQKALWAKKIESGNYTKKDLYEILFLHTGRALPWGMLTGVRPVKLMHKLIRMHGEAEAKKVLMQEYRVSEKKADLLLTVAKTQQPVFAEMDPYGYSLYVHIPFCPTRCGYCSFATQACQPEDPRIERYLQALIRELEESRSLGEGRKLQSVYIGGGTPSILSAEQWERLLLAIRRYDFTFVREFTAECGRPDTITAEKLKVLAEYGVDRVSVNPQSMSDETLVKIGRSHSVEDTRRAVSLVREGSFLLNMDLIAGLPGEDPADMERSLRSVIAFEPENITVHTLAQKKGSAWQYEDFSAMREKTEDMVELSHLILREQGYEPYYLYRQKQMMGNLENTGFSKPGTAGFYNIAMMEQAQSILGTGLGATTQWLEPESDRIERGFNVKDPEMYIAGHGWERKRKALEYRKI